MFKIGDLVRVIDNPHDTEELYFPDDMRKFTGNTYTVCEISVDGFENVYRLETCERWMFDETWLVPADSLLKCEDINEKEIMNMFI